MSCMTLIANSHHFNGKDTEISKSNLKMKKYISQSNEIYFINISWFNIQNNAAHHSSRLGKKNGNINKYEKKTCDKIHYS